MSRELDAKVAEKVFGHTGLGYYGPPAEGKWTHINSVRYNTKEEADAATAVIFPGDGLESDLCRWGDGWGPLSVPEYTDYASADYEVLKHVRETWTREQQTKFYNMLEFIWAGLRSFDEYPAGAYEPGDYSKAALKALGEEIG